MGVRKNFLDIRRRSPSHEDEDAKAIGRRVLELFERGRFGYDNVNLPSSSPGVCQAGMSNSSENGVYIWAGNCLQATCDMSDDRVAEAITLLREEQLRRKHG